MDEEQQTAAYKLEVGRRLREARLKVPDRTQEQVANAMSLITGQNVPPSRVANYEQGTRLPDPLTLQTLCHVLGTLPSVIYGFEEAPQSREEVALIMKYRLTDNRGRQAIQGIAESQPAYGAGLEPDALTFQKAG